MAYFDELPAALLGIILSYIPDARSLCRLECSCKTLCSAANNDPSYWAGLYRRKWSISKRISQNLDKSEYKRRYELDKTAERQIRNLSMMRPIPPPFEDRLVANIVVDLMTQGRDVMEICRRIWEDQRSEYDGDQRDATYVSKCVVPMAVLHFVHCSAVLDDLQQLCENAVQGDDEGLELEEFAILGSCMFYDLQKETSETTTAWIKRELDNIAVTTRAKLVLQYGEDHDITTQEKLDCLNAVFFEDLEFSGNVDDYYNFCNSLLHATLQRRKAIPMTLAVLYCCVGRRIGLKIDIIGLPGHIVCEVPALHDCYVDVFRGGISLTARDCEQIVNSYGYRMVPEYLSPLSPVHVFRRILNNLSNCVSQLPTELLPRLSIESMRTMVSNPSEEQAATCRQWYAQAWVTHSSLLLDEIMSLG